MDKCWYDPQTEAFASKARAFYASCAQTVCPIPYTEETFVAVVTTGYQMLKTGEFPTIKRVKEELTNYNQATGNKVRKNQIALIFRGKEVGKGQLGSGQTTVGIISTETNLETGWTTTKKLETLKSVTRQKRRRK